MHDAQRELRDETRRLGQSLRATNARGSWGELQLRRVCELAGMLEHCDFAVQQSLAGDEGLLRPDLVVRLPGGKTLVVDAKAPLSAWLAAADAADEETRRRLLLDHARQVRAHMAQLGAKGYWSRLEATPEFVVMFLPGEAVFSGALQHDPALIEYGVAQQVIPASPTTLIALLRAAAYGWRQERVARNAEELSHAGRELYERLRAWVGHQEQLRRGLERAVEAYNAAVGSLDRMVLPQARRLRDLGAAGGSELEPPAPVEATLRPSPAERTTTV